MEEIVPGIWHWTAFHERIRTDVHSYYVPDALALIDPMEPDEGVAWFGDRGPPERILLTNRHHYRHSGRFVDRYGCRVLCHSSGLHEFEGGPAVAGFSYGDELAPGITAYEVGSICPEDAALRIAAGGGTLSFADGLIRSRDGSLGFVPDSLLGDGPVEVKRGLRESLRRLLELDFDNLLFAHGQPMAGGGKRALREFLGAG